MTKEAQFYTLTILERDYERLRDAVFSVPGCEGAAYLLCARSQHEGEIRFLVQAVEAVAQDDYLVRESHRLSIDSASYARIAKRAVAEQASVIFVHSHPDGIDHFSPQDDREEPKLMDFLSRRIPDVPHGSLVIAQEPSGRIWDEGRWEGISKIRIVGSRFRVLAGDGDRAVPEFFDRQVRAFGPDAQRALGELHIGVVGAGGTGSATAEQLLRLGVGHLSVFDGDDLAATNVTRVYGSTISAVGRNKALMLHDHLQRIGLTGRVEAHPCHISIEEVARRLRACDIVFGCTDKQAPRALLVQLALRYLIPVIDMGVVIDSDGNTIRSIVGRITTVLPGEACLFCRGRITPDGIRLESLPAEERRRLAREGYAPELGIADPAVVMFTTAVAAQAVTELMHRLTGFMGDERQSSEVLMFFNETMIKRNRESPSASCFCSDTTRWATGDAGRSYLGVSWPR